MEISLGRAPVMKPWCRGCGGVPMGGDADLVLVVGYGKLCGKCALAKVGVPGLRDLPRYEKDKLRLSEIGVDAMRQILGKDP